MDSVLYAIWAIGWLFMTIVVDVWLANNGDWNAPIYIWLMFVILMVAIWTPVILWD